MRDLYCDCGTLVARLERGSLIKKGVTFKCPRCSSKNSTYEKYENIINERKRDNFNAFNDVLKKSGHDINDYI
jgi:phage FluMu protein Com